ncbi:hypothetical protein [Streptomyces sp. NPDC002564]|uniref:hypothetical protein n=1 Tax=Streptomyces sp. NPDC002564 TaxID=3364649 RepID=UPI00367F86A6
MPLLVRRGVRLRVCVQLLLRVWVRERLLRCVRLLGRERRLLLMHRLVHLLVRLGRAGRLVRWRVRLV